MATVRPLAHRPLAVSATLAASAALVVGACLAVAPAQAATVPGAPAASLEKQTSTYYVPAGDPAHVDFRNKANGGSSTFPAGTYLITDTAVSAYPGGIEILSERHEARTSTYRLVTLTAPGPLSLDIAEAGEPGRTHWLSVTAVRPDFGDPATMTPEQIEKRLETAALSRSAGWDEATVTATTVPGPALDTFPVAPDDATNYMSADAFGIGADVEIVQVGNRFTAIGPNGETRSMNFGRPTDTMIVGDWDGDGVETVGLRRGSQVFLDNDWVGGSADVQFDVGRASDEVLTGDFDGDGIDTIALRRGNTFFITDAHRGGTAPVTFAFGRASDLVLVDDWHRTGTDSIGVVRYLGADSEWDGVLYLDGSQRGGAATESYHVTD